MIPPLYKVTIIVITKIRGNRAETGSAPGHDCARRLAKESLRGVKPARLERLEACLGHSGALGGCFFGETSSFTSTWAPLELSPSFLHSRRSEGVSAQAHPSEPSTTSQNPSHGEREL